MTKTVLIAGAAVLLAGCAHQVPSYQSPYTHAMVSPGLVFLGLPAAVQNTIRAEGGMAEITDIGRYTMHGATYYKVWFQRSGVYPPLYIAPDGSVLNADLTVSIAAPPESYLTRAEYGSGELTLGDLPAEVVKTIQARAKSLEIERITETTVNDQRIYEIHFKDSKDMPVLKIDQNGKVIESAKQ